MSDKKKLEVYDIEQLEQTAIGLFNSFWWESTEEGHDYWAKVHSKLISIAHSARTGEPRGDLECTVKPASDEKPDYLAITRALAGG